MKDWKDTLASLTGYEPLPEEPETPSSDNNAPDPSVKNSPLRLSMERAGRGGKTVTIIRGFRGTDDQLDSLCRLLKQKCGVGGSVKDGEIIIQGDHRTRLITLLKSEGYSNTK